MDGNTAPQYEHAALLTIDVQRDTLDGQPFEIPGTSAIVPRIARLAAFFRSQRRPIIHVVRLYKPDGSNVDLCRRTPVQQGAQLVIVGTSGAELAAPLLSSQSIRLDSQLLLSGGLQAVGPEEWIMYKARWGAFYRTPLEQHLRGLGVSTLVFTGCNFPNCPRMSIYEASERDFRVVAIENAISGLDRRGRAELENIGVLVVDTESYLRRTNAASQTSDSPTAEGSQ